MIGPALAGILVLAAAEQAQDAPVFAVAIGADAPLAGGDQNEFLLPCGGGPASFDVDADGKWWVVDAIAGKVVVFERDGKLSRTITFPAPADEPEKKRKKKKAASAKQPHFRSDIAVDGKGGAWILDATAKAVEHYGVEGTRETSWSSARLELPRTIVEQEGELWVVDHGAETLLRFGKDGEVKGATPGADAAPATGGAVFVLASDGDATWLESWPEEGPLGIPARKRLLRVQPAAGKVLHDTALLGGTDAGEVVLAAIEGTDEARERVRVMRVDRAGKVIGERVLPAPKDDATPIRRWRLTKDGKKIAWFRVDDGRFQAFETDLPRSPKP